MNTFFTQLKNDTEKIRLSESERSLMRSSLEEAMRYSPMRAPNTHSSRRGLSPKILAVGLSVALVAGGSVAYAAEGALPGDTLYSVKLEVNERVLEVTAVSTEAKVAWYGRATERRIEELAKLAYESKLTPDTALELEARIEESATKGEMLVAETEEPSKAIRAVARFAASRSVARTLSMAAFSGAEDRGATSNVRAAAFTAQMPEPEVISVATMVAKDAPSEEESLTFSVSADIANAELSTIDTELIGALEKEAEQIVVEVEKRIDGRTKISTTTREDARERVSRLKERLQDVREDRDGKEFGLAEGELRQVLERGAELDVALKTEEKIDIEIVPRLLR